MEPITTTSITVKNGKMYETWAKNGKTTQINVFEDLNHDGKFDANEVTTVFKYSYREDGFYKEKMYADNDKDGTLDVIREQSYTKDGKKAGATTWKELNDKCCSYHSNMQNIRESQYQVSHLPSWEIQ